jgi:hypothetical protein
MTKKFMLDEYTTSIVQDNKLLTMFDCVRFGKFDKLNIELLKTFDDYHIILTHGVMPELINFFLDKNFHGLNPEKFTVLSNNLEIAKLCMQKGVTSHTISEYIFTNEERYNISPNINKTIDCIFPGRPAKGINLFEVPYTPLNILIMNRLKEYPVLGEKMTEYYNMAKCGLMTTESEGSCLSVGEMLSCGIPVVSVKIKTDAQKENYYPHFKTEAVYGLSLPNTLGGRELWLDNSNSIVCNRNDYSIQESIHLLLDMKLDATVIRNNFLAKLNFQRSQFFYVLKNVCDVIGFDFFDLVNNKMSDFINLPYGNSTINSEGWVSVKKHVVNTFQ